MSISFQWIFNVNNYLLSVGGFAPTDVLTSILLCSFLIFWLKPFLSCMICLCMFSLIAFLVEVMTTELIIFNIVILCIIKIRGTNNLVF